MALVKCLARATIYGQLYIRNVLQSAWVLVASSRCFAWCYNRLEAFLKILKILDTPLSYSGRNINFKYRYWYLFLKVILVNDYQSYSECAAYRQTLPRYTIDFHLTLRLASKTLI